jgi:phosphoesterase RecJ-like protein
MPQAYPQKIAIDRVATLVPTLRAASTIVLCTHKQCDGDGLGAQLALYYGLKKAGKRVRVLNVDETPRKYAFLGAERIVQCFEGSHVPLEATDVALIFDTNDHRLVEPLYSTLKEKCREIIFIDHHPVLVQGPPPTPSSIIDVAAASTGEIAYSLLCALGIEFDAEIARALYASIVFDTHLFRYIRRSPNSHLIAAELLRFERDPEEVHRRLFSDYTVDRMSFLSRALGRIQYAREGRIAVLKLRARDMLDFGLDLEASRDVIDLIMNIESLQAAVLFREDGSDRYKLSLRSKGAWDLLAIAESVGGGGHPFAAGAYLEGPYEPFRQKIVDQLDALADADDRRERADPADKRQPPGE